MTTYHLILILVLSGVEVAVPVKTDYTSMAGCKEDMEFIKEHLGDMEKVGHDKSFVSCVPVESDKWNI